MRHRNAPQREFLPDTSSGFANITGVREALENTENKEKTDETQRPGGVVKQWLAWKRRSRVNKALFSVSVSLGLFVTVAFTWATLNPAPGDFVRYFAFYWVWGLCAVGLLFGMAEYKTSPLRKGRERGHLFILLYIGALLIVTRALNAFLYYAP